MVDFLGRTEVLIGMVVLLLALIGAMLFLRNKGDDE